MAIRLINELGDFHCQKCDCSREWRQVSRPTRRINSITGLAKCRSCGETVFLKRIIGKTPAEEERQARHEFAISDETRALLRGFAELDAAAPLCRNGPLLVFQYIAGESPLSMLDNGPVIDAGATMDQLGKWFANFHLGHGVTQGGTDLHEKLSTVSQRLSSMAPRSVLAAETLAGLEREVSCFRALTMPHCRLHGDAKPTNFLIQDGRVVGIDIDGAYRNLPEYDLAQFLGQYLLSVSGWFFRSDGKRVQAIAAAFLGGYQKVNNFDDKILFWLSRYFLLNFWLSWRSPTPLHRLRWDPALGQGLRAIDKIISTSIS